MISQEAISDLFSYDPETGWLTLKQNRGKQKKGDRAGSTSTSRGKGVFRQVFIFNKPYKEHRVIWLLVTGRWPETIDHINHDPTDNRWVNLREVTHHENMRNQSKRRTNTTGAMGVCKTRTGSFAAYIKDNGKQIHLGVFGSIEDAVAARADAVRKLGYHENHGH